MNRTQHMALRMGQRGISDKAIALIWEYGRFNDRGDRLILTRDICLKAEKKLRDEIRQSSRSGGHH